MGVSLGPPGAPLLHVLQTVDRAAHPRDGGTFTGDSLASSWGSSPYCASYKDWWGWLPAHNSSDPSVGWL